MTKTTNLLSKSKAFGLLTLCAIHTLRAANPISTLPTASSVGTNDLLVVDVYNGPSQYTTKQTKAYNVMLPDGKTLWVSSSGNDSTAVKGLRNFAWANPHVALAAASSNDWVIVLPGTYNEGQSICDVPHNVNFINQGTIYTSADLNTNGCFIVPGNNSIIYLGDIQCDTNAIKTKYDASLHTGYWAGLGSYGGIVSPNNPNKCYTNASIIGGRLWNGTSDNVFFQPTNFCSMTVRNVEFHGFWDLIAGTAGFGSVQRYYDCYLHSEGTWFLSTQSRLVSGTVVYLHNCVGISTNSGSGGTCFNTSPSGSHFEVYGGYYFNDNAAYGNTAFGRITGTYNKGGTNFIAGYTTYDTRGTNLFCGDGSGLTNLIFSVPTNALTVAQQINMTNAWSLTNASANVVFTSLENTDPTQVRSVSILIDANGSSRTVTLSPTGIRTADGNTSWTCTNGQAAILTVSTYGQKYTNAAFQTFR